MDGYEEENEEKEKDGKEERHVKSHTWEARENKKERGKREREMLCCDSDIKVDVPKFVTWSLCNY